MVVQAAAGGSAATAAAAVRPAWADACWGTMGAAARAEWRFHPVHRGAPDFLWPAAAAREAPAAARLSAAAARARDASASLAPQTCRAPSALRFSDGCSAAPPDPACEPASVERRRAPRRPSPAALLPFPVAATWSPQRVQV